MSTAAHSLHESSVTNRFLDEPCDETFTDVFKIFNSQLVSFFRSRGCESTAEDLAQEVMLTVYRKAEQIRERTLFRGWVFKIARNRLARHWSEMDRKVETVDLDDVPQRLVASSEKAGTLAFEFQHWMSFLDAREREAVTLRFIEQWEYHEIAARQSIPIGTAQWRVFNAKKKLAPVLKRIGSDIQVNPTIKTMLKRAA